MNRVYDNNIDVPFVDNNDSSQADNAQYGVIVYYDDQGESSRYVTKVASVIDFPYGRITLR